MENNETIIENVIEQKEDDNTLEISLSMIPVVAGLGAAKQLATQKTYIIGLGAALLFGKKAGLKTIGVMVGANAVYNTARYLTGEFRKKK